MDISHFLISKTYYKAPITKSIVGTSSQDGGIGRYTVLPCTTKRRATTNLKTKNNQYCREIGKSDNQGVKKETFTHIRRRGGDGQPERRGIVVRRQLVERTVPHWHADKLGGTTGERERLHNPGFQHREIKPQNP